MIIDAILLTASALLFAIAELFAQLPFEIPTAFYEALNKAAGYTAYFKGLINIPVLTICLTTLVSFFTIYYVWHTLRWAWAHMPWLGKHEDHKMKELQ